MSKAYQVVITQSAYNEIEIAYHWIAAENPIAANKWRDNLLVLIETLEQFPKRAAVLPEATYNRKRLRQLIYENKHHHYRILFEIRHQCVYIMRIIHSARNMS